MAPASALVALCLLSVAVSVRATCTTAEDTSVSTCINTFLTANSAVLSSVAGTSACEIGGTIDCPSGDTSVQCVNNLNLPSACKTTLEAGFNTVLSAQNTVCTYQMVMTFCPTITRLDTGSSAGQIGASFPLVTLVSALLYLLLNPTLQGHSF